VSLVPTTQPLQDLERLLGQEVSLDVFHGTLRRSAQALRSTGEVGTMLVTCSDEFLGEVRAAFARDVARPLTAHQMVGSKGIFAVSNLGGRVEPGAIALADEHFGARSSSSAPRLLLVVLFAHVGRILEGHEARYGFVDRFGARSPCCGALTHLLEPPESTAAVRHPWFDQLTAFFGPRRLETLRQDRSPLRLVRAAAIHAVLQSETALADLLREGPRSPARILMACSVAVNQPGTDGALLAAFLHLRYDGTLLHVEGGGALRSTPEALEVAQEQGRLRVRVAPESQEPRTLAVERSAEQLAERWASLSSALPATAAAAEHPHLGRTRTQFQHLRKHVERARHRPSSRRAFARPLLRGLVQGLSLVAPELGLAAFALQAGHDTLKAKRLERLLREGPRREEARAVLHQMEAEIQQLPEKEAHQVLEVLLAENSALWRI
jgi:hypothetical protein